jgi:hypothetical protein
LLNTSAGETWLVSGGGGVGPGYFFEDLIGGFQLKEQTSWRFQKTRRFEKSINPEVWFVRDWPAVPLREGLSGS